VDTDGAICVAVPDRAAPGPYGALQEVLIMAGRAPTTGTFSRDQLMAVLGHLEADGRWSPVQSQALLDELDRSTGTARAVPYLAARAPLGNRLAEAAGYAGAVLVGAAGAVLAGQHWHELGRSGRVALLLGVTLVLAATGVAVALVRPGGPAAFRLPGHDVRRRVASMALTIAAATAAGAVGNLAAGHTFPLGTAAAVLVLAGTQWLAPSAVSETAGLAAVALLVGAVLEETDAPDPVLLGTLIAVGLAWASLAWTPVLTVPTLGLTLGLGLALYWAAVAAFYGTQPDEGLGIVVLVLLAAAGLAGYVRTARWPLAAAAALALTVLVFRLTSDSLGAPVALLLTGLLLLAMGAVVLVRRRTAEQSRQPLQP
jgi:hypothetical protein